MIGGGAATLHSAGVSCVRSSRCQPRSIIAVVGLYCCCASGRLGSLIIGLEAVFAAIGCFPLVCAACVSPGHPSWGSPRLWCGLRSGCLLSGVLRADWWMRVVGRVVSLSGGCAMVLGSLAGWWTRFGKSLVALWCSAVASPWGTIFAGCKSLEAQEFFAGEWALWQCSGSAVVENLQHVDELPVLHRAAARTQKY